MSNGGTYSVRIGESVRIECNEGYRMVGPDLIECNQHMALNSKVGKCVQGEQQCVHVVNDIPPLFTLY